MEEIEGGGAAGGGGADGTGTGNYSHIWWALASAAQLGWAISSFKRGHAGDSHFMPFKAFSVASLFVGATATAAVSVLHASGIHKIYFTTCVRWVLNNLQCISFKIRMIETRIRMLRSPQVEDLLEVGANIRTGLGVRPRAQDK